MSAFSISRTSFFLVCCFLLSLGCDTGTGGSGGEGGESFSLVNEGRDDPTGSFTKLLNYIDTDNKQAFAQHLSVHPELINKEAGIYLGSEPGKQVGNVVSRPAHIWSPIFYAVKRKKIWAVKELLDKEAFTVGTSFSSNLAIDMILEKKDPPSLIIARLLGKALIKDVVRTKNLRLMERWLEIPTTVVPEEPLRNYISDSTFADEVMVKIYSKMKTATDSTTELDKISSVAVYENMEQKDKHSLRDVIKTNIEKNRPRLFRALAKRIAKVNDVDLNNITIEDNGNNYPPLLFAVFKSNYLAFSSWIEIMGNDSAKVTMKWSESTGTVKTDVSPLFLVYRETSPLAYVPMGDYLFTELGIRLSVAELGLLKSKDAATSDETYNYFDFSGSVLLCSNLLSYKRTATPEITSFQNRIKSYTSVGTTSKDNWRTLSTDYSRLSHLIEKSSKSGCDETMEKYFNSKLT